MTDIEKNSARKPVDTGQNNSSTEPRKIQHKESGKQFSQVVYRDWCKKCGICSSFCPKNVIGSDEYGGPVFERPQDCIGCRFCELHCPDFAITVEELGPGEGEDKS